MNLPEFTGKDLSEFAENFGRFLRMTGQTRASGRVKCDLLLQCCKTKYLEKQVKQVFTKSATFADVLVALERQYPTYKTDPSIRAEIQSLAMLPNNPKPSRISELLADLDQWVGRLTPGSYGSDELLFWLVAKLTRELWDECWSTAERKTRARKYEDLSVLPLELALEKEGDQHLNAYRPRGGGSGSHCRGYQGHRPGQGTTPKDGRIMSYVQDLFWCDARDEQGSLLQAPDRDQHDCFVVQGKKQETNTGGNAKLPDHYGCTITCAFCGKRKHYEDECYHKQAYRRSLRPRTPVASVVARATPTRTMPKASPRAGAKDKVAKAKVDEEAATASLTKTRTRNRPEGTQILRQGGTLSHLVGNPTRDLRPVPRRKANKNKGPSVLPKMGPSPMPASAPASCSWCVKSRRRGSKTLPCGVLTGTRRGAYRPGVMGTYPSWGTRIPRGTGYWGHYIYCGQENFTLWGPEEHPAYCSHPHGRWAYGAQLWGL